MTNSDTPVEEVEVTDLDVRCEYAAGGDAVPMAQLHLLGLQYGAWVDDIRESESLCSHQASGHTRSSGRVANADDHVAGGLSEEPVIGSDDFSECHVLPHVLCTFGHKAHEVPDLTTMKSYLSRQERHLSRKAARADNEERLISHSHHPRAPATAATTRSTSASVIVDDVGRLRPVEPSPSVTAMPPSAVLLVRYGGSVSMGMKNGRVSMPQPSR